MDTITTTIKPEWLREIVGGRKKSVGKGAIGSHQEIEMSRPSVAAFVRAMRSLPVPGGRQSLFLRAHCMAPGKVLTATRLAKAAGYKSYDGINLQYGLMAQRIGKAMGRRDVDITLLVEGVRPRRVSNSEWLLAIRPEFAKALKQVGWI